MKLIEITAAEAPDDGELLKSVLAGEAEAFATLYRRRQGAVYRFALQMSGSSSLAEDVTQEVFMLLLRDGTSYNAARGPLNAFLLGIARNLVRQRLGREHFYAPLADSEADHSTVSERLAPGDPLADLTRNETIETVRKVVLSLPPRYREVIVLCELQEMSYAEAARVLECAVGTVRSRLSRGRALLIEKMQPGKEESAATKSAKTARCFA